MNDLDFKEDNWIMEFDLLSLRLDMDGEQADEMRDFMRKIVASARAEGRREELKEQMRLLAIEIKYAKLYKQPTGRLRDFYDKMEITLNS